MRCGFCATVTTPFNASIFRGHPVICSTIRLFGCSALTATVGAPDDFVAADGVGFASAVAALAVAAVDTGATVAVAGVPFPHAMRRRSATAAMRDVANGARGPPRFPPPPPLAGGGEPASGTATT